MGIQVRSGGFLQYTEHEHEEADTDDLRAGREKLHTEGYSGGISAKAAALIRKYVRHWVTILASEAGSALLPQHVAAKRLCFVTLTLPATQQHDDRFFKRLLCTWFLPLLRRRHGVKNYLWRAETQRNGSIHFHLLIDVPIPHHQLRTAWNACIEPHGYIDRYRAAQQEHHATGFTPRPELFEHWTPLRQEAAYLAGVASNWANPNTTDIHRLTNVKNVVAYIAKYVTKNSNTRLIEGRLWGCSDELRNIQPFEMGHDSSLLITLQHEVERGTAEAHKGDGWVFYSCDVAAILQDVDPTALQRFEVHWRAQAQQFRETG